VFVSHPSPRLELQSLNGKEQDWNKQDPVEQEATAFGIEHGTPHVPQLLSVVIEVSQPVAGERSQSAYPASHELNVHVPEGQTDTACA